MRLEDWPLAEGSRVSWPSSACGGRWRVFLPCALPGQICTRGFGGDCRDMLGLGRSWLCTRSALPMETSLLSGIWGINVRLVSCIFLRSLPCFTMFSDFAA